MDSQNLFFVCLTTFLTAILAYKLLLDNLNAESQENVINIHRVQFEYDAKISHRSQMLRKMMIMKNSTQSEIETATNGNGLSLDQVDEESMCGMGQPCVSDEDLVMNEIAKKNLESLEYSQTKMIQLQDRPDLGLIYHQNASLLSNKQHFAIISADMITNNSPVTYFFNLPITCQAWRSAGFGCFIIIPYHRKDPEVQIGLEIVKKHLSIWGESYPGSIVILEMQVDEENADRTIRIAQTVRLFVAQLLRYSMSSEEFLSIQNSVYLLTTDVDLIPVSNKIYKDFSHDINSLNTVGYREDEDHLYVALSCIGASVGIWNHLADESQFANVHHFNSSGLVRVIKQQMRKSLAAKASLQKSDWYVDQLLASDMIKDYLNQYGWDKLHNKEPKHYGERVNRGFFNNDGNHFQFQVDRSTVVPFKDSHICRETYYNKCWWNMYHLYKRLMSDREIDMMARYRSEFIDEILVNDKLANGGAREKFIDDEAVRQIYLKIGAENDPPMDKYDIREKWTAVYPRIFFDNKPMFVDWNNERVFFEIDDMSDKHWNQGKIGKTLNDRLKYLTHTANLVISDEYAKKNIDKNRRHVYKVVPKDIPKKLEAEILKGKEAREIFLN